MVCSEALNAATQASLVIDSVQRFACSGLNRFSPPTAYLVCQTSRRGNNSLQLTCWFGSRSGVRRVGDVESWFNPLRLGPHATELKNVGCEKMRIRVIFCLLIVALIAGCGSTQSSDQGDKEPDARSGDKEPDARSRERHRKHWQQEAYRLVPEFVEQVDALPRTSGGEPSWYWEPPWHWFALEEHIKQGFADTLVPPFLDEIKRDPTASGVAQRALVEIGRASVPPLMTAVQEEKNNVREIAVAILGRIGPSAKAAVPILEPIFLNDADPLQFAAFRALRSIGDASSPVFIKAHRKHWQQEAYIRLSALLARIYSDFFYHILCKHEHASTR